MKNDKNLRGLRIRQRELRAAHTIGVEEGGTMFMVSGGAYAITLPLMSDAGAGWHCSFMSHVAAPGGRIHVKPSASESTQSLLGTCFFDTNVGASDVNADSIGFTTNADPGDIITLMTDGNVWYAYGLGGADASIDVT